MSEAQILQQAKHAIDEGDRTRGQQLLLQVIRQNPQSEVAWLWLSAVIGDPAKERDWLEQVLRINPDNAVAQRHLATLGQTETTMVDLGPAEPMLLQTVVSRPVPSARSAEARQLSPAQAATMDTPVVPAEGGSTTGDGRLALTLDIRQVLGLLGCVGLLLGVLVPIVRLPIVGTLNYFQNGRGDGVIILVFAAASLLLSILGRYRWLWLTSLGSFGMLLSTLVRLLWTISSLRSQFEGELEGDLFGGLAQLFFESVQIEWGWAMLLLGAGLILAAAAYRERPLPWRIVVTGAALAIVLAVIVLVIPYQLPSEWSGLSSTSPSELSPRAYGGRKNPITAGKEVAFEGGTLQVLEVHDPCAFLVRDCLSVDREHVRPVPGTRYVSVKFEFTCSPQQVVCETVPEASLELLLEDGRRIEDDWCFGLTPRLGEEDVAAGRSVQGWRAFRVPDDGEISSLMIDPWEGPTLYAALPAAFDGYGVSHDWIEVESGRLQIVPALRRDLEAIGLDVGVTARIVTDDGERGLQAQICEEDSFYFDEQKALDDHAQVALDVARLAAKHRLQGEMLHLRFGDCSSFSISEIQIAFRSEDLHMWEVGSYRDNELLQRAFVMVE